MKLSISIPDPMGREIRDLAKDSQRTVSFWVQRAWLLARARLKDYKPEQRAGQRALKKLATLRGVLKKDFPKSTSVELAHQAFRK